jgi:hypothetical protein
MKANVFDIAIVGAGPAGLHAAYVLASQGDLRVAVVDQGAEYDSRIRAQSFGRGDILRGIGGAGTLAGGKLCGIPACMELWRKTWYAVPKFKDFLGASPLSSMAKDSLLPSNIVLTSERATTATGLISKDYPSVLLLKNEMRAFVSALYGKAKEAGCEIKAHQTITRVHPGLEYFTLETVGADNKQIRAKMVMFATGRSSAGTVGGILAGTSAKVVPQSPDLGIRFAMPHAASDLFVNHGQDVKLKRQTADFTARTFCVCTGGDSANVTLDGLQYMDGHFTGQLTQKVNVGIVARSAGVIGYHSARQYAASMGKLLNGGNMSLREFLCRLPRISQDVAKGAFQDHVVAMGDLLRDLVQLGGVTGNLGQCEVVGATIDRYWPRIETDHYFETHQPGLFVIGDAAGISRGYIQAMWSAHCAAHAIVKRMRGTLHNDSQRDEDSRAFSRDGRLASIAA